MREVAIVGMGPWGLAALERLVSGALEDRSSGALRVHVIEPGTPGSGVFGGEQPDYLILNTPCGQHSLYPFPDEARHRAATGFYEWAISSGYQWVGGRCRRTVHGQPITPHDFLPRRLMGEYLAWFYRRLVAEAPRNMEIVHHPSRATDIVTDTNAEVVTLSDGGAVRADHVILTTGLTANRSLSECAPIGAYPVSRLQKEISSLATVAVSGMGLAAIDVVAALTVGRGGTFERRDGRLHYRRSGAEPRITLFSRRGFPYCAKSIGSGDITGVYRPAICTREATEALARSPVDLGAIDAAKDLLPLVLAEMTVAFYSQAARLADGPGAAPAVSTRLAQAWHGGTFALEVSRCAQRFGSFDAHERLFLGDGEAFVSSKDYQARVAEMLESDIASAAVPNGGSPTKVADEVLRALRDTIRGVVDFGALTPSSYRDFQSNIRGRIGRLVAGPPVQRSEELLALLDAEVLETPFGPGPCVEAEGRGAVVSSSTLDRPYVERVDHLVVGHLEGPSAQRSASGLLRRLAGRGRLNELLISGEPVGSIGLSTDFHPLDSDGRPAERISIFGALSEGARYYTAYIPSPLSRVRAFLDAQVCAESILGGPA
ncbi:MAG: FAD/NAD(P)-binding protein [Acidimicrobiales bacterium]